MARKVKSSFFASSNASLFDLKGSEYKTRDVRKDGNRIVCHLVEVIKDKSEKGITIFNATFKKVGTRFDLGNFSTKPIDKRFSRECRPRSTRFVPAY